MSLAILHIMQQAQAAVHVSPDMSPAVRAYVEKMRRKKQAAREIITQAIQSGRVLSANTAAAAAGIGRNLAEDILAEMVDDGVAEPCRLPKPNVPGQTINGFRRPD